MNKRKTQILSFVSGLAIAAVIVGVTINKSKSLRSELESQINSVLKTTRSLVDGYKSVASKSMKATSFITNDPDVAAAGEEAEIAQQAETQHNQWEEAEANAAQ